MTDVGQYRVEVFFSRKGARSCSIVGATFWGGLRVVDRGCLLPVAGHLGDLYRKDRVVG